jgi:hypothetical protein
MCSQESVLLEDAQGRYWLQVVRDGVVRSCYIGPIEADKVEQFALNHGLRICGVDGLQSLRKARGEALAGRVDTQ